MATQYVNKATLNGTTTIYWVTTGSADNTGAYSGYNPANLTNISVDYTTTINSTYTPTTLAAGGDLDGYYPNPNVVKLQGRSVSSSAPTDGYVLSWDNNNSIWKPSIASSSSILRGTFSSRPAAGTSGRIYLTTDGPLNFYDNGSAWKPFGVFGSIYESTPSVSTLTAINAGGRSTTNTDTKGGFTMVATNCISADDFRILKTSVAAPYTFTVHVVPTLSGANYSSAGLVWRNSTSGNIQVCGIIHNNGVASLLWRNESANNNGTSPTYTTGTDVVSLAGSSSSALGYGIWFRLTDDNANRTLQYSNDGFTFHTVSTITRPSGITPDEVGVFIGNANGGGSTSYASAFFDSWLIS